MADKRKITCITGTRADYPRVKAVLREIEKRSSLELSLIVTGSHLLKEYGYSVREIERDGFEIAERVEMFVGDYNTPHGMAKAAARCSDGVADALERLRPDLVLITVDRVETLAATQSTALMNFPIAHIQGGEVTGTIDESIRHAVTKMSHIHFPATPDAAERIVKMGERPEMVYCVGCPYIDIITSLEYKSKQELAKEYGFDAEKPLVLFTQHAVTTEFGNSFDQYKLTIDALEKFSELEIVALYSNTDAGGAEIIREMNKVERLHIHPNIDSEDFLALMKSADLMIGNSSAAIREAPSFKLPAINIGSRQQGRLRADNVIDVPHDVDAIAGAIRTALYDEDFKKKVSAVVNPYGDGKAAVRIVDILESIELTPELIQKRITY